MTHKLAVNDIVSPLNFEIDRGISVFRTKEIMKRISKFDFEVFLPSKAVNLQRDLVWSLLQKQQLILSLIKGVNIPLISLVNIDDDGFYQIIDGKQRLTAAIDYCKSKFSLKVGDNDYYIDDLDVECQLKIKLHYWEANVAYSDDNSITDDDKISWFEQINFAGTQQDVEHLRMLRM